MLFFPKGRWIDSVYWTLGVELSFYGLVLALLAARRLHWLKRAMAVVGLVSTGYWGGHVGSRAFAGSEAD